MLPLPRNNNLLRKSILGAVTGFLFLLAPALRAQNTGTQIWCEYFLNYPFAKSFNLENAFAYSTVTGAGKWHSFDFTPTVEWAALKHVDFQGAVTLNFTQQTASYNTTEIRPMLGSHLYVFKNKLLDFRVLLRLEYRNVKNQETNTYESSIRPRARAEVVVPLLRDTVNHFNKWYFLADFEWLFVNDDVEERFANRIRLRGGVGYTLSRRYRAELLYMSQQSRNTISTGFRTSEDIIRIRLKQFLDVKKKSKLEGTGG